MHLGNSAVEIKSGSIGGGIKMENQENKKKSAKQQLEIVDSLLRKIRVGDDDVFFMAQARQILKKLYDEVGV